MMKEYTYRTDGEMGEVKANSLREALEKACREAGVTKRTIADGAWCWVEESDTGRRLERGIVG